MGRYLEVAAQIGASRELDLTDRPGRTQREVKGGDGSGEGLAEYTGTNFPGLVAERYLDFLPMRQQGDFVFVKFSPCPQGPIFTLLWRHDIGIQYQQLA